MAQDPYRWGFHAGEFHAYPAQDRRVVETPVETVCGQTILPPDFHALSPAEQSAPRCRRCRKQAWERTNPGLKYPVIS